MRITTWRKDPFFLVSLCSGYHVPIISLSIVVHCSPLCFAFAWPCPYVACVNQALLCKLMPRQCKFKQVQALKVHFECSLTGCSKMRSFSWISLQHDIYRQPCHFLSSKTKGNGKCYLFSKPLSLLQKKKIFSMFTFWQVSLIWCRCSV